MKLFTSNERFPLEAGGALPRLELAYHTYGELNAEGTNVIWVCHALTANSDVQQWWPGMVGEGLPFDTGKFFVICANIPGSCYGSTGPLSTDPSSGQPYYEHFPFLTIRDMVRAFQLLAADLGVRKIHLLAGGSMGGYQALEWCLISPGFIDRLFLIATAAQESPWRIAIHTAQRMAIEADGSWKQRDAKAGANGLRAARAIGVLTYRNPSIFEATQKDKEEKLDHFRASSYLQYQGDKLVERFNAYSYWILTKAMDTHHVARDRASGVEEVLGTIKQKTLVIGISSDMLCLSHEQEFLAKHIPQGSLFIIDSDYGHDGFLTETSRISALLRAWMNQNSEILNQKSL